MLFDSALSSRQVAAHLFMLLTFPEEKNQICEQNNLSVGAFFSQENERKLSLLGQLKNKGPEGRLGQINKVYIDLLVSLKNEHV